MAAMIGRAKIKPVIPNTRLNTAAAATRRVKYWLALSSFPSPNVLETMALPPVPIMNPMEPSPIRRGMVRLIAANGVFPTKLDTKSPSTMLYKDVQTIMTTDGSTNLISFL